MHDEIVTSDMARFGSRERGMAADLLTALRQQGFPDDFEDEGVTVAMNTHSGYVFLTNTEYQVAMLNGDRLESWYSCPECGHEGFKEDMEHEGHADCARYLRAIGAMPEEAEEVDTPTAL
jgi:hypothetical protein